MTGLDGFALCRIIKETPELSATPVIIISGRKVQDEDIVEGYERGADDYTSSSRSRCRCCWPRSKRS